MEFLVRVSPQLLESITLTAIEAYCYGDGVPDDPDAGGHKSKEILGHIWGFRKITKDRTIFFLDRMNLSKK